MKAMSACELGLFQALDGAIGAEVYQDVPQDAALPFVVLGDMGSRRLGGKDDPDRLVSATIGVVTQGQERKPCIDLVEAIETLLDGHVADLVDPDDGAQWRLELSWSSSNVEGDEEADLYVGAVEVEIRALR